MSKRSKQKLREYILSFKNVSGIYQIRNIKNNKIYVGSAVNLHNRWYKHKSDLNKRKHDNSYLQNSWSKHGEDNFTFEVIEIVEEKEMLIKREQFWMDELKVCNRDVGYNLDPFAGSRLGSRHSPESRAKISKNRAGIKHSEETKKKMSETRTGMKRSESFKRKMSKIMTGKKHSEETKKKIGDAQRGRKNGPHSEETKRKISEKNRGRTTMPKGEDVYNSTFTNEEVAEIKLSINNGDSNGEIAKKYGVDSCSISSIRTGKSYSSVLPGLDLSHTVRKTLTKEEVIEVRELYSGGSTYEELASRFSKSVQSIRDVCNRRTFKSI